MNDLLNEIFRLLIYLDKLAMTWVMALTPIDYLQWLGCITGVSGAYLLACNNNKSGWGFVLFLISNVFWIAVAILMALPGMLVQQLAFTGTSVFGIYCWLWVRKPDATQKEGMSNCRECGAFAEVYIANKINNLRA